LQIAPDEATEGGSSADSAAPENMDEGLRSSMGSLAEAANGRDWASRNWSCRTLSSCSRIAIRSFFTRTASDAAVFSVSAPIVVGLSNARKFAELWKKVERHSMVRPVRS
jgi:hypothetical protein